MNYKFKTISKRVMGDLHTPVSIYLKVRDIYPESALLESSDFHGNENSLSYIALCPLASIGINNGECTAVYPDGSRKVSPITETHNVADAMNAFLSSFSIEGADRKVCGLFGYTAFDAVRYFENIPVMLPTCYTYYISIYWSSTILKTNSPWWNWLLMAKKATCRKSRH